MLLWISSAAFGQSIANALPSAMSFAPSSVSFNKSSESIIRVRIDSLARGFTLTGSGLRFTGSRNISQGYRALSVSWRNTGGRFRDWTVSDRDTGEEIARFKARSFEVSGTNVRVNLKPAPTRLAFVPEPRNRGSAIDVVGHLPIEEYVRGVLPAEMPSGWPLEALKAQAVAARTYALFRKQIRQAAGAAYDVESNVMDQVYISSPDLTPERRAKIERAVRETRGLVLETGSEVPQLLAAHFHADCGGHTEDARVVWGEAGAGATADQSCPINPNANWRLKLRAGEIIAKIKKLAKPVGVSGATKLALADVQPISYTDSGRVRDLQIAWNSGEESVISAHDFRMAIGHDRIRSTNFTIKRTSETEFHLAGKGFGHGVGMCQWGARALAQQGHTFKEILTHYYPKSILTSVR